MSFKIKKLITILNVVMLSIVCCGCSWAKQDGGLMNVEEYFIDDNVISLANAAANGDTSTVQTLVKQGVDVNSIGVDDMTPLVWALINKNKAGVSVLLDNGANPNYIASNGASMVTLASIMDDDFFLKSALSHGGDPNIKNPKKNMTALIRTVYSDKINNARILIDAGAKLSDENADNESPILEAALIDRYEFVVLFLQSMKNEKESLDKIKNKLMLYINNSNLISGSDAYVWKEKARDILLTEYHKQ